MIAFIQPREVSVGNPKKNRQCWVMIVNIADIIE